ncbi:5-bromo-4-chloroindolyl phosphate hydrolysis family protein [Enterococcus plantarum]|uniref:5-bromo-4-chloroindolyl phosphate hydrolysis family protein n=1 Tax=Enterococcus TaxID=1350 RepID=UPI001A8C4BD4|nr:5-bromo-4-chloroindolyl phosphate hydrolysis family protein [Enterococcus plantarum]MBO0423345.1 5-bromo-4-chloroindolyl phosphate hydrolysis family protein [Enterococcus plantarum]MBO0466262.1 5-bromo-4-chloroindolyl phosphate hydrolysis family protein [Enterococcus plantarum]
MRKGKFIQIIAYLILAGFILRFITGIHVPVVAVVFLLLIVLLFTGSKKKSGKKEEQLPTLTKSKEEHYETLGMTNQEIVFFRDTMNTTKKQIIQLQENMNASTKLRAIDLRNDTLRVSKALFKELVKDPKKLHLANHFLYTHLPNLVDLTGKYLEIDNHEIKTKQTYEKLEESAQIIDQVSKLIKKDYEQFVAEDLEDLDVEISLAKNSLNRDNERTDNQK